MHGIWMKSLLKRLETMLMTAIETRSTRWSNLPLLVQAMSMLWGQIQTKLPCQKHPVEYVSGLKTHCLMKKFNVLLLNGGWKNLIITLNIFLQNEMRFLNAYLFSWNYNPNNYQSLSWHYNGVAQEKHLQYRNSIPCCSINMSRLLDHGNIIMFGNN